MSITLEQLNQHLNSLSLPVLTGYGFSILQGHYSMSDMESAFVAAHTDKAAWAELQRIIDSCNAGNRGNHQQSGPNNQSAPRQDSAASSANQSQNHGAGQAGANEKPSDYNSLHVYGSKAALCFNASETRGGVPTVNLDGAVSNGHRSFDWNQKITIQLTKSELPVVVAVMLGMLPSCKFSSHGPANDKGFSVQHQGKSVFIQVFAKDKPAVSVPVSPEDTFYVSALLLDQLKKASGCADVNTLVNLIGATVAPMKNAA